MKNVVPPWVTVLPETSTTGVSLMGAVSSTGVGWVSRGLRWVFGKGAFILFERVAGAW